MRVILHMGDPYTLENPCSKRISVISDELRKRGHDVIILAPETLNVDHVEGVVYCRTIPLKKKTAFERLKNQSMLALNSYKAGKSLQNIDVVLTTCPPPLINLAGARLAKHNNAKLIYDVRDIWPDVALEMGSFSAGSIYFKTFEFIKKYMLKHADLVTAVSEGKVNRLISCGFGKKTICVPNGFNRNFLDIEIDKGLFESIREKGKTVCSYIGNIGLAQGVDQLLYVAEKSKDESIPVHFMIYGSGVEEERLRKAINEKGLDNISLNGVISNKNIRTVLAASDMSIVSLVNSNLKDSIPTKLYEALGVGCPVFLIAEGNSTEVLRNTGLGIAVSPNDYEKIMSGFKEMYESLDDIRKNKQSAMDAMFSEYSLQRSAQILVDEMEQLVKDI